MLNPVWLAFTCGLFLGLFTGAALICILVVGRQNECDCFEEDCE